ncbi:MAG: DNA-directed RNA polymerase subunit beta' [Dehalococcoidia bacterium]|nr:DNA-directed RNA polymerase subunit beta' [Dehalococcoidia bacterium]
MLEVNDFNAVRIALASPEQIRSWSYGEVMKPETINYRTLKPEKDGLFCEKIFGPTKDFECYCGKYKRVRYKGIICDKCGVEVARSKVRRERMGHIELASPVSHIWFVKGTPSRLGLLLDVSPRSLERILYFAQHIITEVDEDAKRRAIERLQEELEREAEARERQHVDRIAEIELARDEAVEKLQRERDKGLAALDAQLAKSVDAVMKRAATLEKQLSGSMGKAAPRDIKLEDTVVIAKGDLITNESIEKLKEAVRDRVSALEGEAFEKKAELEQSTQTAIEEQHARAEAEIAPLRQKALEERDALTSEYQERIQALEEIRDPVLHDHITLKTDAQIRELQEKYGDFFSSGMGAEAVYRILQRLDLDRLRERMQQETQSSSGQRRKKAVKRLRVVEALRKSGNKPEWMIFTVLPVLPPDLRPMVQLDGGRFATSDLNDLYRRVINRNNRLKRLLDLGAPEIIIRNEKRMLQEAVDSLIDNGRRGRAVSGQGNHKLKSLSDMLKGKQGRFRQNLLGKRVDYSGRSVIVVGPDLKLHQCGLPKRMALELFKPFIMHALVDRNMAHNIKSAKRIVERARPEVWDVLDEVIKTRPVLLNRAPTLHRLGIQAFEPVLVEGSAIQIHPLVCAAFNADFDGDQMAVHVPLSREAVAEARQVMLSTHNLLLPSSGEPTVAPTLDIVLGCFYMTMIKPGVKGEYKEGVPPHGVYSSFEEAKLAYDLGLVDLQARVKVRDRRTNGEFVETSVGRIIFNEILPDELGFHNEEMDKRALKALVARCHKQLGGERTAQVVDEIKRIGFEYCTKSGTTIAINDIKTPEEKDRLLAEADARITEIEDQYDMGLITEQERYDASVAVWNETTEKIQEAIQKHLDRYGSVYLMATSGAKGNIAQIRQMAGMRGLMSDPSGRIIDLPIRSSFREGLSVLEYFISTHGARKGLADTALRTADSGYLTRRLIDVAQDVIILEEDCGTVAGVWLSEPSDKGVLESLRERIIGRWAAMDTADPRTGEIIVERNQEIDEEKAERIEAAGIERVYVRSPLTCQARQGLCRMCYGRNLGTGELVDQNAAVGIIAAQSIGEPGTQLTMRTFHTGGVAGVDITSGLPRVEELFEARVPKGHAIISEIDGVAEITHDGESRWVKVTSSEFYTDRYDLPDGAELMVEHGQWVDQGTVLARVPKPAEEAEKTEGEAETALVRVPPVSDITAHVAGHVSVEDGRLSVIYEEREEREYPVGAISRILVEDGEQVHAGQKLTDGPLNPQDVLRISGPEAVQLYLVEEVQKVYRSQGVNINDKHIEVIIRQMLRKVRVDTPGDTEFLPGELVDRFRYEEENGKVLAEGGEPATAVPVLLGVTKASLSTESFLAAASFQETTRVLTEAAISGMTDRLLGLKENVIIGKLIPARAKVELPPEPVREFFLPERGEYAELPVEGEEPEEDIGEALEALMREAYPGAGAPSATETAEDEEGILRSFIAEPEEEEETPFDEEEEEEEEEELD